MAIYFGTDGIRGVYGEELSSNLVHKCGNALSRLCKKGKVLIGRDTRTTGDLLSLSLSSGLTAGGADVIDVGITPTPVVAYLTKQLDCDFGIVVSASHNPAKYNGIKIYDHNGYKISEEVEKSIERKLFSPYFVPFDKVGKYTFNHNLCRLYKNAVLSNAIPMPNKKIVIDCANGATITTAKQIFSRLNCKVIYLNDLKDGNKINDGCGAVYPDSLVKSVLQSKADMGFAFDGDGDRICACDENGNILDGDDILFILASSMKDTSCIVGTSMTNKGLENALNKRKIKLLRADVGDKYVAELMRNTSCLLGGEPSGHIINRTLSTTGDGVLTALTLAKLVTQSGKKLSELITYKKFPQINVNVEVIDKFRVINSDKLSSEILSISQAFGKDGRVILRASGTENKIRIMCEHKQKSTATLSANRLKNLVLEINKTNN